MAFRRDVLASLGGFDPRLDLGTRTRGGGDLDMLYRVLESDHAIRYEPNALVRHLHRSGATALFSQMVARGTGFGAHLAKQATRSPADARAVRRYRRRWLVRRYVRSMLGAVRHRRWLDVPMTIAEGYGNLRGARAFAAETTTFEREFGPNAIQAASWTAPRPLA
jgi:hypothetical protein